MPESAPKIYVDGEEVQPIPIRKLDREMKKPISDLVKAAPSRQPQPEGGQA